jgi:hypothetical protein
MAKIAKPKEEAEVIDVPALVITPDKAPVIGGNFAQVESFLQGWKEKVSALEMTEKNLAQVEIVKKESVALRNRLAKIQTDTKRLYFNDPKDVFDKKMKYLLSLVDAVERTADKVLDVQEQRRRDGLNKAFDVYKEDFQAKYKLEPGYLERFEYKEKYYNKTAVEKASKDDMEQQFIALKKEQDARAASLRLIKTMCKDDPRLNVQHWIDQLDFKDIATVTEEIAAEKERLANIGKKDTEDDVAPHAWGTVSFGSEAAAEEEAASGTGEAEKIVLGIPHTIDFSSDFPDRTKTKTIRLTYPCDLGDAIKEMFKTLASCNIKAKILKEEAVF